jgi:hypothetical protein
MKWTIGLAVDVPRISRLASHPGSGDDELSLVGPCWPVLASVGHFGMYRQMFAEGWDGSGIVCTFKALQRQRFAARMS